MFRRWLLVPFGLLVLGLTVVPAGGRQPGAGGAAPAAVRSEHLAFVRLDAKEIRDNAVFREVKKAFTAADGPAAWDRIEWAVGRELGIKPTDIDTATACVTELDRFGEPGFVVILTTAQPIQRGGVFGLMPGPFGLRAAAKPDAQGFYPLGGDVVVHFPDDRTVAVLHRNVAAKYLAGYAKDRAGWPLTPELTAAATGHTLFVNVRVDKLPPDLRRDRDMREFGALLAARDATLTADLKGKELRLAARAGFADAVAAGKAKHKVHGFIGLVGDGIDQLLFGPYAQYLGAALPAVKEAERALAEARVEVAGAELTASAVYKADFDTTAVVNAVVTQVRTAAARMRAQNNLKQIGLALHNYSDVNGSFPVHGTKARGAALTAPTDKPLLSWRVAILPYIEQNHLYSQFRHDEPWDSEHNKKLIAQMPSVYAPVVKPGKPGYTHLQMAVGPNAMRPGPMRLWTIPDGTSNTVAVAEAAEPVIWTKPDDVMLPGKELPKDLKKRFGGQFDGGFNVLLWDGSVRFIKDTISDQTLGRALNPSDGYVLGDDW